MFVHNHDALRHITPRDFAVLGLNDVAYVLPKTLTDRRLYAIHTADGNEVAVVESFDLAVATIQQNDLEPVRVH